MFYLGADFPNAAESQCAQHGANRRVVVDRAFNNMIYSFLDDLLQDGEKSDIVMSLTEMSSSKSSDIGKQQGK